MREPWEKEEKDPAPEKRRQVLRIIARIVKIAAAVASLMLCGAQTPLWLLVCGGSLAALIGIYVKFPEEFTLVPTFKGWNSSKTGRIDLTLPFFVVAFMLFSCLEEDLFGYGKLLFLSLLCTVVVGGLLLFSREYREEKKNLWVLIVAFVLCGSLLYWTNKVCDPHNPQTHMAVVEETMQKEFQFGNSANEQFFCVISLEDGRRYALEISSVAYEQIEKGDTVEFVLHFGALGMEYGQINLP